MSDLFPDPIAEELPKSKLPRWLWFAAVPVVIVPLIGTALFGFGLYKAFAFDEPDWETFPAASDADAQAVMSVVDLPDYNTYDLDLEREHLQKVHYWNGTFGLDYTYDHVDPFVAASIYDEATLDDTLATYDHCAEREGDVAPRDEVFRWGDRSSFVVLLDDDGAPSGYSFVGRRAKRVVVARWGALDFEELEPDELRAFLTPIVERMAEHVLE